MTKRTDLIGALAAGLLLAAPAAGQQGGLALTHVTVVDTTDGSLRPGQGVVIRDGRIAEVADMDGLVLDPGLTVIEARGQYLVPGYLDMHAHGLLPPEGHVEAEDHSHAEGAPSDQSVYWDLMLAHGVTGFRQMSGSAAMIEAAQAVNAARAAGGLNAPEVLSVPGEMFLGQAATPADGVAFVQARIAEGGDFLKLFAGRPDVVRAILAEAQAQGFPVAGHLPPLLPSDEASRLGWDAIEHLGGGWGLLLDCARAAPAIRERLAQAPAGPQQLPPTFILNPQLYIGNATAPVYQGVLASHDPALCDGLADTFVQNGTWQVPTLIRLRTMNEGGAVQFREDPNLRYLDPETRALWQRLGAEFTATVTPETRATLEAFYALQRDTVGRMHGRGVRILAGSDLGGIWVLPGLGLHQEFRELAQAGLSPLAVLQATTLHAAEFLGRSADLGAVAPGRVADLVLLDANPLEDVANLAAIGGLVLQGRHVPREALAAMLERVAEAQAE